MSVHAGTILHIGGRNVIDRIQSAGLGDVTVPVDVIREVGNPNIVDKVPQDPDFTFTLETLDVSTELESFLTGKVGSGTGSAAGPGDTDPDGTVYDWQSCGFVNIPSPWKNPSPASAGNVAAGHLVPGYYVNRLTYQYGVTDNAQETVELGGGSFYYAGGAPTEDFFAGTGGQTAFVSADPALPYRKGGATGSTFKWAFGVIVDGVLQTEGVDFTQSSASVPGSPATVTVTFTTAPANGAVIRFCYFTSAAKAYPQATHADTVVKPAAVRGRHICVYLGSGGARVKVGSVQSFQLEATIDGEVEREFCNEEIVGRTINGTDVTGNMVVRSRDAAAFLTTLRKMTGIANTDEVIGWLNDWPIPLQVQILNPKNPAQVIKTLYVSDAKFQVPGTPARVNTPTDFTLNYQSKSGNYQAKKGDSLV